jgi:Sec-independent protein secretion pathway component TatC
MGYVRGRFEGEIMFTDPLFLAGYVVLAFVVALLGHGRRIGVLGFFILALLLTPPLILLVLIVTRPKPPHHLTARHARH